MKKSFIILDTKIGETIVNKAQVVQVYDKDGTTRIQLANGKFLDTVTEYRKVKKLLRR